MPNLNSNKETFTATGNPDVVSSGAPAGDVGVSKSEGEQGFFIHSTGVYSLWFKNASNEWSLYDSDVSEDATYEWDSNVAFYIQSDSSDKFYAFRRMVPGEAKLSVSRVDLSSRASGLDRPLSHATVATTWVGSGHTGSAYSIPAFGSLGEATEIAPPADGSRTGKIFGWSDDSTLSWVEVEEEAEEYPPATTLTNIPPIITANYASDPYAMRSIPFGTYLVNHTAGTSNSQLTTVATLAGGATREDGIITLDGVDDYAYLPDDDKYEILHGTDQTKYKTITVAFRISKLTAGAKYPILCKKASASTAGWEIYAESDPAAERRVTFTFNFNQTHLSQHQLTMSRTLTQMQEDIWISMTIVRRQGDGRTWMMVGYNRPRNRDENPEFTHANKNYVSSTSKGQNDADLLIGKDYDGNHFEGQIRYVYKYVLSTQANLSSWWLLSMADPDPKASIRIPASETAGLTDPGAVAHDGALVSSDWNSVLGGAVGPYSDGYYKVTYTAANAYGTTTRIRVIRILPT